MPVPEWLTELLGVGPLGEGESADIAGRRFAVEGGILRDERAHSESQRQTADAFSFKWAKRATFESDASLARASAWLLERYGDVAAASWWADYGAHPVMVDAGCGAAHVGAGAVRPAPRRRALSRRRRVRLRWRWRATASPSEG